MSKKPKKPRSGPSAEEIVDKWHARFVSKLKPKYADPAAFAKFEPKLRKKIREKLKDGDQFGAKEMKASLRVAGDMARICKILQPQPNLKKISTDLFEAVLSVSSAHHQVCKGGGGAGGWCNLNN